MTWIKKLYLYMVTLIGLVLVIIGATMLVSMGLKAALGVNDYITYPNQYNCPVPASAKPSDVSAPTCTLAQMQLQADYDKKNNANQKKRDVAQALAMIIVGTPVFMYHWKIARKEA